MADWTRFERMLSTLDRVQGVVDFAIAHDGETIAAAVSPAHRAPESNFESRIWRVTTTGEVDQLTFGPGGDRSPIMHASSATTPTLILHGTEDQCTPIGQAQELHKALALNGVPTELVANPREGHGFQEREHALDSYRRTVDWFERFVEGEG